MPTERRDNPRRLAILRDAGGLLVVLNGFGGGDLADELRRFREELLFADLEIVTNRIDRLEDQLKKPRPAKQKEARSGRAGPAAAHRRRPWKRAQSAATLGLQARTRRRRSAASSC